MDRPETFGERLRALRKGKLLTQHALVRQVDAWLQAGGKRGFDVTYLSKIENDRMAPPSTHAILALARVLDTPSDELLALAGKAPLDLGQVLTASPGARLFYRRAKEMGLEEWEWVVMQDALEALRSTVRKEPCAGALPSPSAEKPDR